MINSESRTVVNESVLCLLPTSNNSSILNKVIPKTRSLSDLEMILKAPSEDLYVDRRNSVSGSVPMDTIPSSNASAVDVLLGPFKTLHEAQLASSLLKYKTTYSHQNNNQKLSAFMTRSKTNFNDTKVSTTSSPQKKTSNETNQPTGIKSLPIKVKKDHEVSFSTKPGASKIQANSCATMNPQVSLIDISKVCMKQQSFMLSSVKGSADIDNYQENVVTNLKESKTESDNPPGKKKSPLKKKKSISSITKITTLVFFDLETTGLAFQIGKSNVQITEVSMIAMSRKEFEQSTFEDLRDIRIIQKLCLCTRPRTAVSSGAAAVTGLNDENLVDQNPFECYSAEAINSFLSHLPKPVCLLAHNGNNYDFPLLKAEFSRLGMTLPSDILIADTLKAFRVLGVPVFPPEKKICKSVKFTKKGQVSYSLSNLHLYFFNKNPTGSHSSEGDCIALAKVCHRMKDLMLLWIDENCTTFNSVIPMW